MIIISDCNKDIVIPAGLGDNAGVVYETAGVKSLNGETGDLKIKTVNGNDMLGDGNIEIKGGVETVNGETGDVKIKTVNGQSLMGEGDVPVDVGVETLNGQKGNLKIKSVNGAEMLGEGNVAIDTGVESLNGQKGALTLKTVNGAEMLGEGNVAIDTGVESLNGQKGALTLKTVNGNELTGDGNIEIQAGVSSVNGKTGDVTVYDLGNYAICALQMADITLSEQDTDVMLYNYGAGYDNGGWSRYMSGDRTVQILLIGTRDGRGYKVPVEIHLMHDNQENAEMHFTIGDYRYVYSQVSNMHWRFTSKTPVIVKSLKYKEVNNTTKKEVYADVKAHWSNESGYTGDYVYYFMRNGDEILFSRFKINDYALIMTAVLPENIDLTINGEVVLVSCIVFSDESQNVEFRYHRFAIPTNVSQLTNDSNYQTKAEVDAAIENAVSGAGSDDVIVLDGLTQEERKAVYDKLDKTKVPNTVFVYNNCYSFRTYLDGESIVFDIFNALYNGLEINKISLRSDGSIGRQYEPFRYNNTLTLNIEQHAAEGANFECGYDGDFFEYMVRNSIRPNSYFILFKNGIGDSAKPVFAPVSVIWDNNNFNSNTPIRIQFTANEKLYTYLHGDADGKWLFESAKPIGGVQSSEVSNIKVLTQSEYDALTAKDENVLYCIKG